MQSLIEYFNKRSRIFILLIGYILVILFAIIDYITDLEILFPLLYLIPIFLVVWFVGKLHGFLISIVSSISIFATRVISNVSFSHPLIIYWRILGRLGIFFVFSYLLTGLKKSLENEKKLARIDDLTQAANRRYFFELADTEINRSRRYKYPFTIIYIDLDNFKTVNDNSGHHIGDSLLKLIVKTIKNNIRSVDVIARLGGDEFAVLLPQTKYESGKVVIQKVQEKLLDTMKKNNYPVTFSIGAVTFANSPASVDEMIRKVDKLMYSVKLNGKNAIKHEVH